MKQVPKWKFFLLVFLLTCCFSDHRPNDSLPCIDVRKNYPEKEIILTDIADVSYVHLNTENDDYLYKGRIICVTENTIVVGDDSSGSILFYSKEGIPKSRLNRFGNGREEYLRKTHNSITYDEVADEVFVKSSNSIQVYTSTGGYKRKISLPHNNLRIFSFDDQTFLAFDEKRVEAKMQSTESDFSTSKIDSSYFLISKKMERC